MMRFDPFLALLEQHGLPAPVTEYPFAEDLGRKFRADYCWRRGFEVTGRWAKSKRPRTSQGQLPTGNPQSKRQRHRITEDEGGRGGVIVEKDGGTWTKGGHSSGRGILRDMEKANLANELGYCYLRFTPAQLMQQPALDQMRRCLGL